MASLRTVILKPAGLDLVPSKDDVICGIPSRSKHPGNTKFRKLILMVAPIYSQARMKAEKSRIVAETTLLFENIGSRFIQYDKNANEWGILQPKDVRLKVSYAIRDCVKEMKRHKTDVLNNIETPPSLIVFKSSLRSLPPMTHSSSLDDGLWHSGEEKGPSNKVRCVAKTEIKPPHKEQFDGRLEITAGDEESSYSFLDEFLDVMSCLDVSDDENTKHRMSSRERTVCLHT